MEEEEHSNLDSPAPEAEHSETSDLATQHASLNSYLGSVPYTCESVEEMHTKLQGIVSQIEVCIKSGDWLSMCNSDTLLHCWLSMRYPLSRTTRAKLALLYYELIVFTGMDTRMVGIWVSTFTLLLSTSSKDPGSKRVLRPSDLSLDWRPLWRVINKELFTKRHSAENSRPFSILLLSVAEASRYYYPPSQIKPMLRTFLPLIMKDNLVVMMPVICSFMPLLAAQEYLPALFPIWRTLISGVSDDFMIELVGQLSEEHISHEISNEPGFDKPVPQRDIGIWSDDEWKMLLNKCLASFYVSFGNSKAVAPPGELADLYASSTSGSSTINKKKKNRHNGFAKLIVYSLMVDGPVREDLHNPAGSSDNTQQGYLAGSKALDSLQKLLTCTESFFHPSNNGIWSLPLTSFLQRLTAEFSKRWNEEEDKKCRTPIERRLTSTIKREFVKLLRTPALLAIFAKDALTMGLAQASLKNMAMLEPNLIMPQLLERAYDGLEAINETHRTTSVLSMLASITLPLVSGSRWPSGQKNLVPLLEFSIPGIDLNDPVKTVFATSFIASAVQHIRIGDLSIHSSTTIPGTDDGMMNVDEDEYHLPSGVEPENGRIPMLSRSEERTLARESTSGFADWVTLFFRRILALYENLPEEGGKKGSTGGKQEEAVLKSVKNAIDIVCSHLSDQLFDLVLNLVYDYATTNVKANAVRAIGQMVACLARANPDKTVDRFLPACAARIEEELAHGASSIRTTATHVAIPSDTTLHWNISILRGCVGFGGSALLKHKEIILSLLQVGTEQTKSERGYSSISRLLNRTMNSLGSIYSLNSRFVNTDEWDSSEFEKNHDLHWGKMYKAQDVKVEWHVPNDEEISFIMEILEKIVSPKLTKIEELLSTVDTWDHVAHNDFCRFIFAVRSAWSGLPTLLQEPNKAVVKSLIVDHEYPELFPETLMVKAGFSLTDPSDPRYQYVLGQRARFGKMLDLATKTLLNNRGGEDHIDAILGVARGIDVYLLEYAMFRTAYTSFRKSYTSARDANRMWRHQQENTRLVFIKRALSYHYARVYQHSMYRKRSELDDALIDDLTELSVSPYTKVRRYSQGILDNACQHYLRSTRMILPKVIGALRKGTDPDRMKGALYIMVNKLITSYAMTGRNFEIDYLLNLFDCQYEEKPSIQKVVVDVHHDCVEHLIEQHSVIDPLPFEHERLFQALEVVVQEVGCNTPGELILKAREHTSKCVAQRRAQHSKLCSSIVDIAQKPQTHWRYVLMSIQALEKLVQREIVPSTAMASFLIAKTTDPHPNIRGSAQATLVRIFTHVKMRTYSKSLTELWHHEWKNPLQRSIPLNNPVEFVAALQSTISGEENTQLPYIDQVRTGFVAWGDSIKGYVTPEEHGSPIVWESASQPLFSEVAASLCLSEYFQTLMALWSQEAAQKASGSSDLNLRAENSVWIKTIAKMFEAVHLHNLLSALEPLWQDADKYKQRAAAESMLGLIRGSKHWSKESISSLWGWFGPRLDKIFAQLKPDTVPFWDSMFHSQLADRDPRRNRVLFNWSMKITLDFQAESAFTTTKALAMFGNVVDSAGLRFVGLADKYADDLFENMNTDYAEVRSYISTILSIILDYQWYPSYDNVDKYLSACVAEHNPLMMKQPKYLGHIQDFVEKFPVWKKERLPPPRVNQSQYDKVGLSVLLWIYLVSYTSRAVAIFPYSIPLIPEFLAMTELNDHQELHTYSEAVLNLMSSISPSQEHVDQVVNSLLSTIKSTTSWRMKLQGLPILITFFYRNLAYFSETNTNSLIELVLGCLADENVEVREMAAKSLAGLLRCSERRRIIPLRDRFVREVRRLKLPDRKSPAYSETLRKLHSAILGICALVESFPYSVEPWMPPLTEVLAPHASDPTPISTTIRKCASEFKKTHQDTWHTDQLAFDEDQLQSLSYMVIGTSYYA